MTKMEVEEEILDTEVPDTEIKSRKHKIDSENDTKVEKSKRARLFSAKQFRKELSTGNKPVLLANFLKSIQANDGFDYVFEYLESGGNCMEILQLLETESTLSPITVFNITTQVVLKINAKYPQYQTSATEACRFMLNNYISVINKMLNLSSSAEERKSALKLLTAVVTLSMNLAKDVLLNVNFHQTNLELLTKQIPGGNPVRECFIHFLTAFLIDGHYQSLSLLLEKKGILTSIIRGLQYDSYKTVCLIITAMKNHILENPNVSKTVKMKTFHTNAVKDIVNLYNWKGPGGLKTGKKAEPVNEFHKFEVSNSVHEFLLVLCTSNKFGVIFKDNMVGLGKNNQNSLMHTVLGSLERPWDHSYAGQLVVKICSACPDLGKTLWSNLKPFIELRLTEKWLNAIKFAKELLNILSPSCIEFCAKDLSANQLTQVILNLVLPIPILKTIIPENNSYENATIKKHVVSLLLDIIKSVDQYIKSSKNWLNIEDQKKLKKNLSNHITNIFPDAKNILNDWNVKNTESEIGAISSEEYLSVCFNVFEFYANLAPQHLESLNSVNINLKQFLSDIEDSCSENLKENLQIKAISIFIDLDHEQFSLKSELFSYVIGIMLKLYHSNCDQVALGVLSKFFKLTHIFDGCEYEINQWLNGILNLKQFDESVSEVIINVLRQTVDNILSYNQILNSFRKNEKESLGNFSEIFEILLNTDSSNFESAALKKVNLSPMIIGFLEYLKENELSKHLNYYLQFVFVNLFHVQTELSTFKNIFDSYENIPGNLKDYIENWAEQKEIVVLPKNKGKINNFVQFSDHFLNNNIEEFLIKNNLEIYPDLTLNLIQTAVFYFSNLVVSENVTEKQSNNFEKFVDFVLKNKKYNITCETILGNQNLLTNFSLINDKNNSKALCTNLIINIIKKFKESNINIENILKMYRKKIVNSILKILSKPQKYSNNILNIDVLVLFNLDYDDCNLILDKTFKNYIENNENLALFLEITVYSLNRITDLCSNDFTLAPIKESTFEKIIIFFLNLNKNQSVDVSNLSKAFLSYLVLFPYNMKHITSDFFLSLVNINDYHKNNVSLCCFLLKRNNNFVKDVEINLTTCCEKKYIILPFLEILTNDLEENFNLLKDIFEKFEPAISKVLQKPQKAGQHFVNYYKGLPFLVENFMSMQKCKTFTEKVQKFEVTEIFISVITESIFKKILTENINGKQINNVIMTYVHLLLTLFKRKVKNDAEIITEVSKNFDSILKLILQKNLDFDLISTSQNESFKLFCKFALKFGVSGNSVLLDILKNLIKILVKNFEDSKTIMEMLLSHSEFLDVILGGNTDCKFGILSLFLVLCKNWKELMERSHIPVLLSSYRAMVNKWDRTILKLLKLYEKNAEQTQFYDFKPYLWDRAAASHYSVRSNIENRLLRQPKMSDVLGILQNPYINYTISYYPVSEPLQENAQIEELEETLGIEKDAILDKNNKVVDCYDLSFLMPVFSQLLTPENQVQTYWFTRSGALSLTVAALSSEDEDVRKAACHVLSRFYYHLEAQQHGKDKLLWTRYVEAVCKGTALLEDFKLNNFASVYLARMALVLSNPMHLMYIPMSQYLTAKASLDFSTVPELYTFLHSPEVCHKDHRKFALELLRDGLRTEKDFSDFLRSMGFKIFSELYSSPLSDQDTKILILDVMKSVCNSKLGITIICQHHSFLIQMNNILNDVLKSNFKDKKEMSVFISKIVNILNLISKVLKDKQNSYFVFKMLRSVIADNVFQNLPENTLKQIFECFNLISNGHLELFDKSILDLLESKTNDVYCKYIVKYGINFFMDSNTEDKYYTLRQIFYKCYAKVQE